MATGTRATSPEPRTIAFSDLFDSIGTMTCGISQRAGALADQMVEIEGFLVRPHSGHEKYLLTANAGICPDCSMTPEPTILLCDVAGAPPVTLGGDGRVRATGLLEYGFEISPTGDASFLRLRHATWRAATPAAAAAF
jgi:hypothetical protein